MLANPKMNISPSERIATDLAGAFKGESRFGRRRKIGRTANQPWMVLGNRVQHFAGRISAGDSLRVRRECWDFFVPALRRLTALNCESFSRQFRVLFLLNGKQIHTINA